MIEKYEIHCLAYQIPTDITQLITLVLFLKHIAIIILKRRRISLQLR